MELFHEYRTIYCTCCGERKTVPVYCGNRFCPVCSVKRRARVRDRLLKLVKAAKPGPEEGLKFITLTLMPQTDLKVGVRLLLQSFRKMRNQRNWSRFVSGGAGVIEIKRTKFGLHIHMHMLVMSRYFPVKLLSRMWKKASGAIIVDIRPVGWTRGGKKLHLKPETVVGYLTKYLTKESLDGIDTRLASELLAGTRIYQPFGTWHKIDRSIPKAKCECPNCHASSWHVELRAQYLEVSKVQQRDYDQRRGRDPALSTTASDCPF